MLTTISAKRSNNCIMKTTYVIEVKITDHNNKRIKTPLSNSSFQFLDEVYDTEPYSPRATSYFEKYSKRITDQFNQIIKSELKVHDIAIRYKGNECWPLCYSYYPAEQRFIIHN